LFLVIGDCTSRALSGLREPYLAKVEGRGNGNLFIFAMGCGNLAKLQRVPTLVSLIYKTEVCFYQKLGLKMRCRKEKAAQIAALMTICN
jgi:hypothetical protein